MSPDPVFLLDIQIFKENMPPEILLLEEKYHQWFFLEKKIETMIIFLKIVLHGTIKNPLQIFSKGKMSQLKEKNFWR